MLSLRLCASVILLIFTTLLSNTQLSQAADEDITARRALFSALTPAFDPAEALAACQVMADRGLTFPPNAAVPVGEPQPGKAPERLPVATYVVSVWVQIQQSGMAGDGSIPSLSMGAPAIVRDLLHCLHSIGAEIDNSSEDSSSSSSSSSDSPLLTAVHGKDPVLTQWLLDAGADANVPASKDDAFSPLHAAIGTRIETASLAKELLSGHPRIKDWLTTLIEKSQGMQASTTDPTTRQAIEDGVAAVEEALLLFEDNADTYPRPLLVRIASLYSSLFVSALLSAGASPNTPDFTGRTPVHVAASFDNTVAAALLCSHDGKVKVKDKTGKTAVSLAKALGSTGVVDVWAKCGAVKAGSVSVKPESVRYPARHTPTTDGGLDPRNGGWGGGFVSQLMIDWCDVEQVPASLSPAAFFKDFFAKKKPVVVRGGALGWDFRDAWTAGRFNGSFARRSFPVSRIPYPGYFGATDDGAHSVSDIVACLQNPSPDSCFTDAMPDNATAPFYVFERSHLSAIAPELTQDFPKVPSPFRLPPVMAQTPIQPQFFLGPPLSGAPVHYHGDAWNGVAFGAKRWFLYPPSRAKYSRRPVVEWLADEMDTWSSDNPDVPLQCMQFAGDLMFVPRDWGHAVVNVQNTIGVASEFTSFMSRY